MNAVILRLFGSNTNFIAKLEIRVLDKSQKETGSIPVGFERLGDKVRYDVNMSLVKSREISPEFAATMKQMGMDQLVAIRLPEKKAILSIYPGLKAYAETRRWTRTIFRPLTNNRFNVIDKRNWAMKRSTAIRATKTRSLVTEANGRKDRAIVWNAKSRPEGFSHPQMQISDGRDPTLMLSSFRDVKLGRPELQPQFEAAGRF